jgi:hypothetical protein
MDLWGLYITALPIQIEKPNADRNISWQDEDDEDNPFIPLPDLFEEVSGDENMASMRKDAERTHFRSDQHEISKFPSLVLSPLFSYFAMLILKSPVTIAEIYEYSLNVPL